MRGLPSGATSSPDKVPLLPVRTSRRRNTWLRIQTLRRIGQAARGITTRSSGIERDAELDAETHLRARPPDDDPAQVFSNFHYHLSAMIASAISGQTDR